jgi:hypothetical protein
MVRAAGGPPHQGSPWSYSGFATSPVLAWMRADRTQAGVYPAAASSRTSRRGRSAALVVRGEPGVGKTALLDFAIQEAAAFDVVHVATVTPRLSAHLAVRALRYEVVPFRVCEVAVGEAAGSGLPGGVIDVPDSAVYSGATVKGHLCFTVARNDAKTLVLYVDPPECNNPSAKVDPCRKQTWFALQLLDQRVLRATAAWALTCNSKLATRAAILVPCRQSDV